VQPTPGAHRATSSSRVTVTFFISTILVLHDSRLDCAPLANCPD
jgi:hypothetical protein